MLHEINQKLESANIRHDNYVREQQERVARDNEQRKRRVDQKIQQKKQEEERKQQEFRKHQEHVRQFEESQRYAMPKPITPAVHHTPGQKAVPKKRQKQAGELTQEQVLINLHFLFVCLVLSRLRPRCLFQSHVQQQSWRLRQSKDFCVLTDNLWFFRADVSIEEVVISVEERKESVLVEDKEESVHREEISLEVELMETELPFTADKENQERPPSHKSPILKQIKQDERYILKLVGFNLKVL